MITFSYNILQKRCFVELTKLMYMIRCCIRNGDGHGNHQIQEKKNLMLLNGIQCISMCELKQTKN